MPGPADPAILVEATMRRRDILLILLFSWLLVSTLRTSVEAQKQRLPRLLGSSLLVDNFPTGLAVTTEDNTLTIQGGGEWYVTPSMSANGSVIASARSVVGDVPAARPRLIVGIYSNGKWTDYKGLEVYDGTIAVSPDGSRIACISRPKAGAIDSVIRFLDLRTGATSVGPESSRGAGPDISWSPDSRHIAFDREVGVYVLDVDSGKASRIADGNSPSWSPSGEWIAFLLKSRLRLMHPDGSDSREVARLGRYESFGQSPVWSPDSQTILIQSPQEESVRPRMDIYTVNVTSHRRTKRFSKVPPVFGWVAAK
jgi:hypothetical protein